MMLRYTARDGLLKELIWSPRRGEQVWPLGVRLLLINWFERWCDSDRANRRLRVRENYARVMLRRIAPLAETHLSYRSNWLRAAVLGANDGILSTSSLLLGVAVRRRMHCPLSPRVQRAWSAGRCRWPQGSTYPSVPSGTPRTPTWSSNSGSSPATRLGELRELSEIYEERGLSPSLPAKLRTP